MKVALYARVSTDQQSTGLESQVRILKDYSEKNGISDYEIFMAAVTKNVGIIQFFVVSTKGGQSTFL